MWRKLLNKNDLNGKQPWRTRALLGSEIAHPYALTRVVLK